MSHPRNPLLLAGAIFLALSVSSCAATSDASPQGPAPSSANTDSALPVNETTRALLPESIRTAGVLRVASDPTYAPFEYFDTDNKTMIGWDVDLTDAVGATLGLKVEHVPASFDTILPGLASGKYDMAASFFSVTPEREKIVDFVQYIKSGSGVAVLRGNPNQMTMDPMTMCGRRIAGQKGSIQSMEILPAFSTQCSEAGHQPIDVQNFPSQSDANLALVSGRIDGVVADSVTLAYQAKEANGKFELAAGEEYKPEPIGLALSKNSGLKTAVTEAVRDVINSNHYSTISEKWGVPKSVLVTADVLATK
ncbi:polar amino acid transport system substrate-binding protein [Pseudarthrobacter defluvii]|uniref:ABC transporter substrate-binding protein n=1 Tax=Pseudarthrobacter defluvii TaxID=410837 RepID=UPI002786A944|nr:ABC transporter substrate-binding protein [Pseudarthrobacter defluvii]MDQ0769478.1 polar amino acid transport system substrate-binding protein [Pseudarthrobacter defluvii]